MNVSLPDLGCCHVLLFTQFFLLFQHIQLDKVNQVHVPNVYQKDLFALEKYLTYLNQSENLLPLQTKAVIILSTYRSGMILNVTNNII